LEHLGDSGCDAMGDAPARGGAVALDVLEYIDS
jgi:hypothetical protein